MHVEEFGKKRAGGIIPIIEALERQAYLLSADRWLLWLGILFVLSVYFFPTGVVGRLRAAARRRS